MPLEERQRSKVASWRRVGRLPGTVLLLAGCFGLVWPALSQGLSSPLVQCRGNEPFWSLDLTEEQARFSRLAGSGVEEEIFQGARQALDFLDPPWTVWRGVAGPEAARQDGAPARTLVATLRQQACRDTMSDEGPQFDRMIVLSPPDGEPLVGCCFVPAQK